MGPASARGRITSAYRAGHPVGRYPGWAFTFEYNEDVIAALKAAVPPVERSYDPETKEWFVSIEYEGTLLRLFPGFEAYKQQLGLFG